ncbi:hypothetical protein SZL87_14980 [Exiguobacterium indicum]|uniref:Uncharacterized protein n=1 Tax=Exiguobacterium indicum TaxID=296995 RepID=A0ABU8ELC9_9BACL
MKQIKFNLVINGKIVRSIEELKDEFNLDDIYDLYQKRILQKWLRLQGEDTILKNLEVIDSKDMKSELEEILCAFGYGLDTMNLEVTSHVYGQVRKAEVAAYMSENKSYNEVIEGYHGKYEYLKEHLRELIHSNDSDESEESEGVDESNNHARKTFEDVKAIVDDITTHHYGLLTLDLETFFDEFIQKNPVVIMVCLMNNRSRELMMCHEKIQAELLNVWKDREVLEALRPYTIEYEGDTEGMWKYLGDADKTYFVVKVSGSAMKVGEQSDLKVELSHGEINGEYLLLNGLTFKSNSRTQSIMYMEV